MNITFTNPLHDKLEPDAATLDVELKQDILGDQNLRNELDECIKERNSLRCELQTAKAEIETLKTEVLDKSDWITKLSAELEVVKKQVFHYFVLL